MAADPLVIEPVVPFVPPPVAVAPTPPETAEEVDVDDAGALVELDDVLPGLAVGALFAAAVVLLSGPAVVVLLDAAMAGSCMFVDVVVWAWSAVVPSRNSATAMALDECRVARAPERMR